MMKWNGNIQIGHAIISCWSKSVARERNVLIQLRADQST